MTAADRLTIEGGRFDGASLMRNAGHAVAATVLRRCPGATAVDVLAGPGNNGGDGYVVARLLREAGVAVRLFRSGPPRQGTDAAAAAAECPVAAQPLADFAPLPGAVVVDALYGAGLAKPLAGADAIAVAAVGAAGVPVVAVDLPSGVSGGSGAVLGTAFKADLTVTFFRKKPGHLLDPGRFYCGDLVVADIGIDPAVLAEIRPSAFENLPPLWLASLPMPAPDTHKYQRGHVGVFSGGPTATGAARLSAMAAARAGAGAVTMLSPPAALAANAAHLTSTILRASDGPEEAAAFVEERQPGALVLGPGFGADERTATLALRLLEVGRGFVRAVVLDADAITALSKVPDELAAASRRSEAPAVILTPHEGEFGRLFPDIARSEGSKLDKARAAAAAVGATVVYKGPDTVIAAADGRTAINGNGSAWLATAGSGDVLAGFIAGLRRAGHAVVRSGGAGGLAACRGGFPLRAGADRGRPAAGCRARAARAVCPSRAAALGV